MLWRVLGSQEGRGTAVVRGMVELMVNGSPEAREAVGAYAVHVGCGDYLRVWVTMCAAEGP